MRSFYSLLALTLGFGTSCVMPAGGPVKSVGGDLLPASEVQPMRQAAAAVHRHIGVALMSAKISDSAAAPLIAQHFDSLTPENEMKWYHIEPQPGVYSFGAGDKLVAFAGEHGMRVRGHTLVWHSQLAPWVKSLAPDQLPAAIQRHIEAVAGHYKGKIAQWDVVNEAIADGQSGALRADSPFTRLGPAYIEQAFRLAHQVDPQAQLFYNDYDIEDPATAKGEAAYQLCKRLKEAGVPIHGIGMQMHLDGRHLFSAEALRRNIERYAALGLLVEFTEMDVPVGELPGSLEEKLKRQRTITHDIVAACVAVDKCTGVTLWGFNDADSWLSTPEWAGTRGNGPHYPLAFNASNQPKPMLAGILDAFAGR